MKYFAKIRYIGTNFHGFQVQPAQRTVQGELCRAFFELFGEETKVTGCSRTDSGVHALEFCITAECASATVPPEKLPMAISRFLPRDLSLYHAEESSAEFHPRYSAKGKEYIYRIKNMRVNDPFEYCRAWFLPAEIDDDAFLLMRQAAERIVGRKDFKSFMADGSDVSDTVREIFYLTVNKTGADIEIKIAADGFLYNMVRIIVGTLVEVAYGRIAPDAIDSIISAKDRTRAGTTAPPEGLYLNKVLY